MPLSAGDKLGPYEIVAPLGAGGMGEVYRAHDSRLKRDVAIKVLPAALALDPERMARFEREARLLASLDHPNIGAIYGLEESNGTRSLILALIEGPTLADRIAAGPIPLDEAIHIAQQIAEALEYAHDRGVIHRDLKPANVKITPESAVKVLDFGLAKALTGESDTACRRVAQRDCGAALHRNLLELAIGEEPDPFAHRRKEGGFSALRARQRRYLALIQQARVEEHLAVRAAQRESQARAVG